MGILLALLAAAAVFAIAAVVVGREARRLATKAPGRVFEFEDAVSWVCDHVDNRVAAVLTPDDVRRILNWHLEYFRIKGMSSNGSSAQPPSRVVVNSAETVDYVLKEAEALGSPYTAEQVHAVLEAQMTYLQEIGAIAPVADGEETDGDK
jgi:hypothetical protein